MKTSTLTLFLSLALVIAALIAVTKSTALASTPMFSEITDIQQRKNSFFTFLNHYIEQENINILSDRKKLLALDKKSSFNFLDHYWLKELGDHYKIDIKQAIADDTLSEAIDNLLLRVDAIPPSLALAQAAEESAWGTSRFASQGNNYFGQWCYTENCGLTPLQRDHNATHQVQVFVHAEQAVVAYMRNLNSNRAYRELRDIRAQLRSQNTAITGTAMAAGLERYSGIGAAYVKNIRGIISYNDLESRFSL